jgi:hypothetical protein
MVRWNFPTAAVAALVLGGLAGAAPAGAITVGDGTLSDWGVSLVDSVNASCGNVPGNCHQSSFGGVTSIAGYRTHFVEDTNDISNSYKVDPYYGGQNYDVEFMAAAIQNGRMYIAVSSGQRPDNGADKNSGGPGFYGPGDFRMVLNAGFEYGIEVGGGAGHGSGTSSDDANDLGAIDNAASGTLYTLNTSGITMSSTDQLGAGSVYSGVTWRQGIQSGPDMQIVSGTEVLETEYYYSRDAVTTQHSIIEFSVALSDLDALAGGTLFTFELHWGPSCGNDLGVVFDIVPSHDVPVPGALTLFGVGLAGLGFVRRRRSA